MVIELSPRGDVAKALEAIHGYAPCARVVNALQRRFVVSGHVIPLEKLREVPGVLQIQILPVPYPLGSLQLHSKRTVVQVGSVSIGEGRPVIMAGPCSVESRDMLLETAHSLAALGCQILRGGAFKPRTSPYSFQGLGVVGLEHLAEARRVTGLSVVTEVLAPEDVDLVSGYADMLQVGARNMQNFPLLRAVGKSGKPVLLKRSPWANVDTWLQAAEYILAEGNFQVVLCERGICTSEAAAGRHLDLAVIPKLRELTHLPVVVDPSHGTGQRDLVTPMALAALAAGADGLMVEVHPDPARALSDAAQTLDLAQFRFLMKQTATLRAASLTRCAGTEEAQ